MNPWRQSSGQSSGLIVLAQVTGVVYLHEIRGQEVGVISVESGLFNR